MSGGGSSGGSSNTVTQVQQVPDYVQAESQSNQQLANDISSSPFPQYQAPLIADLTPIQQQGQQMAINNASSYLPYLGNAQNTQGAGITSASIAQGLTNPNAVSSYMSPYIQASLAPQLSDLALSQAQNQNLINSQATQSGAFGDARQGAQSALSNFTNQQAINQLTGTAYQNAFGAANQALGQAENTQIAAGGLYNTLAGTEGGIAGLTQQYGLNAANAVYGVGQQQQQQQQLDLNTAYQQFLNQSNWPYQQLNVRESAISNNPYNIATATTLPSPNVYAQGFNGLQALAGLGNSLLGGKQSA